MIIGSAGRRERVSQHGRIARSLLVADEADAKGVRKFARRLEAGEEGGDRVNKNEQTRIRMLTGPVARDRRRNRVGRRSLRERRRPQDKGKS
jgi:hypothetical protein